MLSDRTAKAQRCLPVPSTPIRTDHLPETAMHIEASQPQPASDEDEEQVQPAPSCPVPPPEAREAALAGELGEDS